MKMNRMKIIGISLFLALSAGVCPAEEGAEAVSVFIPTQKGFDFVAGEIVDTGEGDINITPFGIETASLEVEISAVRRGCVEDGSSPAETRGKAFPL